MDALDAAQISFAHSKGAKPGPKNRFVQNPTLTSRSDNRAYTLTLSSKALELAKKQFEIRQSREEQTFEANQRREAEAKERELAAEKNRFEREQLADEKQFKEKQKNEEIGFNQQTRVRA